MKCVKTIIVASLFLTSCSRSTSYEDALAMNKDDFKNAKTLEDATFMVELKSRNFLTIKILEIASDSAYSSVVVSFAKTILPEHNTLDEQINDLAKKKDISLPDESSAEHQLLLSELTSSSRQDFDYIFSRIISKINTENNSSFTSKATEAWDPDVRAFAARNLDLSRAHARLLSNMQGQLMQTTE